MPDKLPSLNEIKTAMAETEKRLKEAEDAKAEAEKELKASQQASELMNKLS